MFLEGECSVEDVGKWLESIVHYLYDFGPSYSNSRDFMFLINKKRYDEIFLHKLSGNYPGAEMYKRMWAVPAGTYTGFE